MTFISAMQMTRSMSPQLSVMAWIIGRLGDTHRARFLPRRQGSRRLRARMM
jgi:hypothetical protein